MFIIIILWVFLITTIEHVGSDRVIIVNNEGNSNSTECCVYGQNCACNSFSTALQYLEDNTIVNITSESVRLDNATVIGSGKVVTNIKIIGNNTTVKCNNTGSVSCTNCVDFVIKGITWDQCGSPNTKGGIYFNNSSNINIDNCTFQNSQTCAVYLFKISYDIIVTNSYFISNGGKEVHSAGIDNAVCGGLKIDTAVTNTTVMISGSIFNDNGNFTDQIYDPVYGLIIISEVDLKLNISRTKFLSNSGGIYLTTNVDTSDNVTLTELVISHNRHEGIKIERLTVTKGNLCLNVLNSTISDNGNGGIVGDIFASNSDTEVTVTVNNTNFKDNRAVHYTNGALVLSIGSSEYVPCSVYVQNSNFINNTNGTIYISTSTQSHHLVFFYEVVIKQCVTVGSPIGSGTVYISLNGLSGNTYHLKSVTFFSNNYIGLTGGALFITTADVSNNVTLEDCVFHNNSGSGHGAAFYVADSVGTSNPGVYCTTIKFVGVNFTNNSAGHSIVYIAGGPKNSTVVEAQHRHISAHFVNNT